MAEAAKKTTQSTGQDTGSGSTAGRGKATGATDPNPQSANLGGATSSVSTGGTSGSTTAGGSSAGSASGSTGTSGGPGASSTRTSGTHDMSANASQTGDTGDGGASGLVDQVRSSASDTFRTVKSNTTAKLEEQKSTLATGLTSVADGIRQLGSNLSGGEQNDPLTRIAADYSETAADKLRTAADYFNSHDVETMYRDVESLARRNPAIFVGGAFALGFLAARFLKSSAQGTGNGGSTRSLSTGGGTQMPKLNAGGGTGNATAI